MDKYIGKLLDGRYEILEIIGVGGMAVVYKAMCHRLNRLVAVKILKDEYLQDEELRKRFQAESQAVAKLSHANIVSVYDVSTSGEVDYIVMELIDGITLKKHMQQLGVISWREAVHFTMQIAKALEHAHSRGVIHRDIKPHNIMLLRDGSVKVADFGIARMVSAQNTLTREALGSVHYISPEQAKGAKVDNRADLYSLGVVMYEMLTGELPFQGESPVAVAIQHINATPRMPRTLNPNIAIGLEQITMRAMCADLPQRYSSATQLLSDLETFRADPSVIFPYAPYDLPEEPYLIEPEEPEIVEIEEPDLEEPPYHVAKRNRLPLVAVLLCVLALAGGLFWFTYHYLIIGLMSGSEWLTVPSLVGQQYDKINAADYAQFVLEVASIEPSDYYSPGTVLHQEPLAGESVRINQNTVRLTISGSVPTEGMPALVNKTSADAKTQLQELTVNLTIRTETEYSEFVEGQVIRTDPEAGAALRSGDTVTLYVSLGQRVEMPEVPPVIGLTLEEATAKLTEAKLTVGLVHKVPDTAPEGQVLKQSVDAGQTVRSGTVIELTVSSGAGEKPDDEPGQQTPPTEQKPEPPKTEEPPVSEPQLVTLDVEVGLPEGEGTILVTIKVDGTTYLEFVADKENGSVSFSIDGVGTKQMDVYFDGVLHETRKLDFGA